jgi:ubiquinone/menaquinone biosynthesis C-methylase UbiE
MEIERSYGNPLVGYGYDLLSTLVFAPVGGLGALRDQALRAFGVQPRMRVLELGCGTGAMTARLLLYGADVTAVDWSEPMLARARTRAPGATYECCEITEYEPHDKYDLVLFSFVLHELDHDMRAKALRIAKKAGPRVAIVDHALPRQGLVPKMISKAVHGFEPPSARAWMRDHDRELADAGLTLQLRKDLARGTAFAVHCEHVPSSGGHSVVFP